MLSGLLIQASAVGDCDLLRLAAAGNIGRPWWRPAVPAATRLSVVVRHISTVKAAAAVGCCHRLAAVAAEPWTLAGGPPLIPGRGCTAGIAGWSCWRYPCWTLLATLPSSWQCWPDFHRRRKFFFFFFPAGVMAAAGSRRRSAFPQAA